MINIVDARMGQGKTSAAIQYMNDHPDNHYLFITPFIEETVRIQENCPELDFALPSNRIGKCGFKKGNHLKKLLDEGKNIALSHKLFVMCDDDTIQMIHEKRYVVFIDEVIDVLEPMMINSDDIDLLIKSGLLVCDADTDGNEIEHYGVAEDYKYSGGRFTDIFRLAQNHRVVCLRSKNGMPQYYFWTLHTSLFIAAAETYVLTYLFDGMPMKALLDMNGLQYRYIGVARDANGVYRFTDEPVPDYAPETKDLIHICNAQRLNEIGDVETALSASWIRGAVLKRSDGRIERLRKNVDTYFRNYAPEGTAGSERLWCVVKDGRPAVSGKGYIKRFAPITERATNKYQHCKVLAYCANIYMNPFVARYFKDNGVEIDQERYALANMVQWLWRGAIRKGQEMWVYVPSRRMRRLLKNWLAQLAGEEVTEDEPKKISDDAIDGRQMRRMLLRRSV